MREIGDYGHASNHDKKQQGPGGERGGKEFWLGFLAGIISGLFIASFYFGMVSG